MILLIFCATSVARFLGASSTRPFIVAIAASTRNSSAFDVVCRVKSKKLCTSTAKHPLNDASATPRRKSSLDLARTSRLVKQQRDKAERQHTADNPAVRKHLQVIVVCLFESKQTVARIIPRVDHTIGAESRADVRMRFDYVRA